MGIGKSHMQTVSFEDVQHASSIPDKYYLICTMPPHETHGLIHGTVPIAQEEHIINNAITQNKTKHIRIIIYGKHIKDDTVLKRYAQLQQLGFGHLYIYPGGLFEWLLLQDIYGDQSFPTTSPITDILMYKPPEMLRWMSF
jgi:hypothetical protein